MFILDNIDLRWFLISLFIGLFVVYTTTPNPEVIVKYPTPDNAHNSVFKDDSDNCYKFTTEEVDCNQSNEINEIPIQKKSEYFLNYRNVN